MLTGLGWPNTPGDSAVRTDLELFIGADKQLDLQILQPGLTVPQDITGWNITWTAHARDDPSDVWLTKSVGAGITAGNTQQGWCQIAVAAADTIGWQAPVTLEWRAERTDSGADAVVAGGLLTVYPRGP